MNEFKVPAPPEELVNGIDARVEDGKVYIALNELLAINSSIASIGLTLGSVNPSIMAPLAYPLNVYRAMIDGLTNRFASELVPSSPEGIDE